MQEVSKTLQAGWKLLGTEVSHQVRPQSKTDGFCISNEVPGGTASVRL